jgi:hypothetical protein
MTDTSSAPVTHPTTEPYPVTVPLNSPALNGAVSDSAAPHEEEPYTIKCICAFEDDDGNTVFCEGCETWQHIECYYEGNAVPEVHNCADCEPRHLDGQKATLRQIHLRREGGDQKSKRSGSKGQKKKPKDRKDHSDQINGFHHRSESAARDQPPAKKPKTNHRSSASATSLAGTLSLPADGRKRASPNSMSPTKFAASSIPLYSNEFMHLYDRDHGHADMNSNLFINLPLAADLASWVTDPAALARVTSGRSAQDIFTWSDAEFLRSRRPTLSTESITDSNIDVDGKHPTWKILKTQDGVQKDEIVGEIKGKIGLLRDYCLDPSNRWQELRHPEPFVFFHPQLPIYIDSRHEGSMLRYARRSCRPNVTMKTYITNEVEYHFCFVAKEDIPANAEITAMWYLDQQLFESSNGLVKQESSDSAQEVAAVCISNVLSHFGGCACVPPPTCLLASVDRRRHPKLPDSKQSNGKRKKSRTKSNVSPLETHNRAGSEGAKNVEDDEHADSHSASGSAREQTRSRDLSPTQGPTDHPMFGGSELSARDKRKIAAAEKKFQQLEQDQHTTQRKKKRTSGQSSQAGAGSSAGYFGSRKATSVGTASGRQSYSPPAGISPGPWSAGRHGSPRKTSNSSMPAVRSSVGHSQYVNSAIQTEADVNDEPPEPSPRASNFTPLAFRLLKRFHVDRGQFEGSDRVSDKATPMASPTAAGGRAAQPTSPSVPNENDDVEMKDVDSPTAAPTRRRESGGSAANSKTDLSSQPSESARPPMPPPWPSTAAHNSRIPWGSPEGSRADQPPPATAGASSPGSAAPSTMSPPSTVDRASQPSGQGFGASAPSPAKKKLSLGDYLIRRGTMATPATPASEKPPGQTGMHPPQKSPSAPSQVNIEQSSPVDHARTAVKSPDEAAELPKRPGESPDVAMKDAPEPGSTRTPSVPL